MSANYFNPVTKYMGQSEILASPFSPFTDENVTDGSFVIPGNGQEVIFHFLLVTRDNGIELVVLLWNFGLE
jgi:hypothetical protein